MKVRSSTPQYYLDYLTSNPENKTYEVHRSDFFPFRNGHMEFWSGYYTTRPNFKRLVKVTA